MADQVQFRGGTTAENDAFTGVNKEISVDTTLKQLRVHDGAKQGGYPQLGERQLKQVDDYSALKALEADAYEQAYVRGRASDNDGAHGVFVWRSGDQSANITADDTEAVWVPPDSDATGASGAWERLHNGVIDVRWSGAVGDDSTDNGAILAQLEADWAGYTLYFGGPEQVYQVTTQFVTTEPGGLRDRHGVFAVESDTRYVGDGATIKLADGESTSGSEKDAYLFLGVDGTKENVVWEGLALDMNYPNNDVAGSGTSNFNFAQIYFTGADNILHNSRVANCHFINTPGQTCLATGQTTAGAAGTDLSDNVLVDNCLFYENGMNCADHTTIFGWGRNIVVRNCVFKQDTDTSADHEKACMDIKGSHSGMFGCHVVGEYARGPFIGATYTEDAEGMYVTNCTFDVYLNGIKLTRNSTDFGKVRDVVIAGNTIRIGTKAINSKSGIVGAGTEGYENVIIRGNHIILDDQAGTKNTTAVGIRMENADAAEVVVNNILIYDNLIRGDWTIGVGRSANNTNFGLIRICNNVFEDMSPNDDGSFSGLAVGVYMVGSGKAEHRTEVKDNFFIDTRGTPAMTDAIELGNQEAVTVEGNRFHGITDTVNLTKSNINYFFGRQARSVFTAAPANGTWEVGDTTYHQAPSAGGNIGWVCTAAGSPGTHKAWGDIVA